MFLRVAEQNTQDELPDEVKRSRLEDLTDSKSTSESVEFDCCIPIFICMQDAHIYLVILIISLNYAIIFKSHLWFCVSIRWPIRPSCDQSKLQKEKEEVLPEEPGEARTN